MSSTPRRVREKNTKKENAFPDRYTGNNSYMTFFTQLIPNWLLLLLLLLSKNSLSALAGGTLPSRYAHREGYCYWFPKENSLNFPTITINNTNDSNPAAVNTFNCIEIGKQIGNPRYNVHKNAYKACMCEIFRRSVDFSTNNPNYPDLKNLKGCNFNTSNGQGPGCNIGRFQQKYCPFYGCCYNATEIKRYEREEMHDIFVKYDFPE